MTDADTTDIIVMYCRVPSPMSFSDMQGGLLPDERNVFTRVILTAEKHGRTVFPILLSSNDPFYAMRECLVKVRQARTMITESGRPVWLQVDGGIDAETAAEAVASGADSLVAGNSVFGAASPAEALEHIRRSIK